MTALFVGFCANEIVDEFISNMPAGNTLLLERTALSRVDVAPEDTEFLKELLVPGSTK